MRRVRRAAVLVIALVAVIGPRPSSAQGVDPTVFVDRTGTAAGERMLITGSGWPGGATLIVELCGHGALRGSVDCDVPHQRSAGVGPSGTFSVELTTALPPSPCPCVVKATDQATQIAATAPIAVAGLPTVPITASDGPLARAVEISAIQVSGGGTIAELFGAGGRRVLEITLVNTGPLPIDAPDVSVAWGTGANPGGFVEPPETERLEPGETQTLTVALHRRALTLGDQVALVEVQGVGEPVVARATTTGYPWGLLALVLVAVQLLLLRLRNRFRGRMRRQHTPEVADPQDGEMLALPVGHRVPAALDSDGSPVKVVDLAEVERTGAPAETHNGAAFFDARPSGLLLRSPAAGADPRAQPAEWPRPANGPLDPVQEVSVDPADRHSNGHAAVVASGPTGSMDRVCLEVAAVRARAEMTLLKAAELSESIVAATITRVREIEQEAEGQLLDTRRQYEAAAEVLRSAEANAREIVAAAKRAAAVAQADADAAYSARRRAVAEVRAVREQVLASAQAAVSQTLDDLEARMRAFRPTGLFSAGLDRAQEPDRSAQSSRAPRLGGLDQRVAHAVSRALADASTADTATH